MTRAVLKIDSRQNATFKKLFGLTTAKGLKQQGLFLLSGEKLVREFLKAPKLEIIHEIVTGKLAPLTHANLVLLSAELFTLIDAVGTHFNILVLRQPPVANLKDVASYVPKGIEVVMPVGDPGNLGALLRSCEAFGVPRVILTQESAHPFLPKSVKASAGSVLRLPLARGPALREFPDDCIALDMQGTPIGEFKWPANGLLVVGEEGSGLGKNGKHQFRRRISIPTQSVESLNAVVAASVALAFKNRGR